MWELTFYAIGLGALAYVALRLFKSVSGSPCGACPYSGKCPMAGKCCGIPSAKGGCCGKTKGCQPGSSCGSRGCA